MSQRDETERMSLRQKFDWVRRDYDEWPGELIAQALDEIDRLRRELADARELLDGLAPGPEQLAREDAARDVAQAWVAYVADWGRGTVERSVEAPLDRLAAAHGLTD